jgi:hypothetical protein
MSPYDIFIACVVCSCLGVEVTHQYGHVLGSSLVYHCQELLVDVIFVFLLHVIGGERNTVWCIAWCPCWWKWLWWCRSWQVPSRWVLAVSPMPASKPLNPCGELRPLCVLSTVAALLMIVSAVLSVATLSHSVPALLSCSSSSLLLPGWFYLFHTYM